MLATRSCRGRGTAATHGKPLGLLLPIARELGLQRLLISCDEDNVPSRRVLEGNGGVSGGETPHSEHAGERKLLF
jgi:predicted acetyltransferase